MILIPMRVLDDSHFNPPKNRKHKCENKLRGLIEWGRQPQISDSETHRISKDVRFYH
jgi:hypothetical protein